MLSRSSDESDPLFDELDPVIRGLGYETVELRSARRKATLHVVLIIHKDGGVDVEGCADVYRAIYPRLEVITPGADIQLEVSSPGIYRNLKSPREFAIFRGSSAKLLVEGRDDWIKGTIEGTSETKVNFRMVDDGEEKSFDYSEIRKAKLDYP